MQENKCLVLRMKQDGRLPFGKHEAHPSHDWWYTSSGGGHQLSGPPTHPDKNWDSTDGHVWGYTCPGIQEEDVTSNE